MTNSFHQLEVGVSANLFVSVVVVTSRVVVLQTGALPEAVACASHADTAETAPRTR